MAKLWRTSTSRISQLRSGRQRLTFAECLEIARSLEIEPLEILASLEYPRAKEHEQEAVKNTYFDALLKTIGQRMNAASVSSMWYKNR